MKKNIYKLCLSSLSLVMVISLSGCGSDEETPVNETAPEVNTENTTPEINTTETNIPETNTTETNTTETNTTTKPTTPLKSGSLTEKFKNGMPDWAKDLGFSEPKGMAFDSEFSQISEYDKGDKTIDSILFIYEGDYETAKAQAQAVSKTVKIPLTDAGLEESVGVAFTGSDEEYTINIEASPQGKLVLSASNNKQRNDFNK